MTRPRRLLDGDDASPELVELLGAAPPARSLDAATRERMRRRVARTAAVPAGALSWLTLKSASAALGAATVGAGIAVGTAFTIGAVTSEPTAKTPPAPAATTSPARANHAEPPAAPSAAQIEIAPAAALPVPSAAFAPLPPTSARAAAPDTAKPTSLSDESALLEEARAALGASPLTALRLTRRYGERFPNGQLAAERSLIEIDALHRLGRDVEARQLATGLLAGDGRGLYAARVQQLLGESTP